MVFRYSSIIYQVRDSHYPSHVPISVYVPTAPRSGKGGVDLRCDGGTLEHLSLAVGEGAVRKGFGPVVLALVVARLAHGAREVEGRVRGHVVDAGREVRCL
jgi:hypothetical protein